MSQWRISPRSLFGAFACFIFAVAILIAPIDELTRYARSRLFRLSDLAALIGEWTIRIPLAALFVWAGVFALRKPRRRGRP